MFSAIVSPNNPRVKDAARLRDSKVRRREGRFLVDGFREVLRAWRSSFAFEAVYWNAGDDVMTIDVSTTLSRSGLDSTRIQEVSELIEEIDASGMPTVPLSEKAFSKIRFGDRDERVIAIVRSNLLPLNRLGEFLERRRFETGEEPLIAVVEGVEKPGNIGAILRSADGAGVGALIIAASEYDVFNPNAIRGSLGSIFHVPIVVAPADKTLEWLRDNRIQRATTLCDEAIPYFEPDYCRPTAIVLGSEAEGLSEQWSRESAADAERGLLKRVRLPMLGVADSLNVSNAAAILFYEARRARSSSFGTGSQRL